MKNLIDPIEPLSHIMCRNNLARPKAVCYLTDIQDMMKITKRGFTTRPAFYCVVIQTLYFFNPLLRMVTPTIPNPSNKSVPGSGTDGDVTLNWPEYVLSITWPARMVA